MQNMISSHTAGLRIRVGTRYAINRQEKTVGKYRNRSPKVWYKVSRRLIAGSNEIKNRPASVIINLFWAARCKAACRRRRRMITNVVAATHTRANKMKAGDCSGLKRKRDN